MLHTLREQCIHQVCSQPNVDAATHNREDTASQPREDTGCDGSHNKKLHVFHKAWNLKHAFIVVLAIVVFLVVSSTKRCVERVQNFPQISWNVDLGNGTAGDVQRKRSGQRKTFSK